MALRAGAAINIDLGRINTHFANRQHGHHGKGFVDFEKIDVRQRPADFGEELLNGVDRCKGEL